MANSLSAFLKENKLSVENRKVVVSKSFVDENGNPIEWEIKKLTAEEDEWVRKEATKKVPTGKRGQYREELDADLYLLKMCIASVVFPPLMSAELQDSYGVKSGEKLLLAMLDGGEYTDLKTEVIEHNGFDVGMDELIEEAKN